MSGLIQVWNVLGVPGRVAAGLCVGSVVLLAPGVVGVARSALEPAPTAIVDAADLKQRREKYEATLAGWTKQIDGRTLFFRPAKPPPPPEPPAPEPEKKDPPPPPPPATYGGPAVVGIVNGEVWFNDASKRKVGAPEEGGLEVLGVSEVPWSVKVKWNGVEFDVPVFSRDTTVIPPPETKKEEGAAGDKAEEKKAEAGVGEVKKGEGESGGGGETPSDGEPKVEAVPAATPPPAPAPAPAPGPREPK